MHHSIVCGVRELQPVVQISKAAKNVLSTAAELLAQAKWSRARDASTGNIDD
jgi:hypothetical protein